MTTPIPPSPRALGLAPSFGFGDRLGLATPGHLEALRREGGPIRGILAQQSIREMARTRRKPEWVMGAAAGAIAQARYHEPWGADADHLKTTQDVDVTAASGFTFYTIDPSQHVDQHADGYAPAVVEQRFAQLRHEVDWHDAYAGRTVRLRSGDAVEFPALAVRRAAVKYGKAILAAIDLGRYIARATRERGLPCEIELSVDETEQPTTPAEHYIIADRLREAGVRIISLAPRFIGEMEKGVDYKGDLRALEDSLRVHAAIAAELGPYKLSLHSGSDKLSMYPAFARATRGVFHVKTAGTSYLEALRVVARHDRALFREIVDFARSRYDTDRATYHVSAQVASLPAPAQVADDHELVRLYLQHWSETREGLGFTEPGRQVLHCTFGSVLTHERLGPALQQLLLAHPETYAEVLAEHFARHLRALRAGMA